MSDTSYQADYYKARADTASGERMPRYVREQLSQAGIQVPLRLIRQVWTDPAIPGRLYSAETIINGFKLFDRLVKQFPFSRYPDMPIHVFMKELLLPTSKRQEPEEYRLQKLAMVGITDIEWATKRVIIVALQVSYTVPVKAVAAAS